jgi:NAD(P)-dependent dehydrogenase (short-subunit alcohol dehydrogenase family)
MNISQHTHQQTDRRPQPAAARRVVPGRHDGRLAVITGAAQGIGRAYAERLGAEGAHVVIADVAPADGVRTQIEAAGGSASAIECDVCDPASVTDLASAVADLGGADILLHNAGIYPMGPHDRITFEEWRRVFAVNLDSMFLLSQVFLPHMRKQQWGRIVGISSAMFHAGSPGSLHYVASKGGIIGFIRALAAEVGPDGVTVNAIAPGLIRSDGTSKGIHDELGLFDMVVEHQAVKRTGLPEDLAGAISFLLSDDAEFITGQTLVIDGGLTRA